jgi:F-type H+-transporting ATPase subunit gamma
MKMVAAAQLRKAQERIFAIRPYAYNLKDLIAHLLAVSPELRNIPLLAKRPVERVLIVVVTADRGLCGGFNSNIIRSTVNRVKEYSDKQVDLYTVGRKGTEFFVKRDYQVSDKKLNFFNRLNFEDAVEISRNLITLFKDKKYDRIEIIYNEFKSAIRQKIIIEQFLPFVPDEEMVSDKSQIDFIYEPDKISIINEAVPKDLNVQIWRILLESNAAEQGARMTAMESATDNAEELINKLTLFYNRARQAAITKEISEIVGGAEALKE